MRALVVEGGSMRAAYANGVLAALEDAGERFDAVYGTSAGGALAAWWAAGQARVALGTWRYAQDPRILAFRRILPGGRPVLDHDALFRIVYETEVRLDVEAVRAATFPVIVTATDVETQETRYVDLRDGDVLPWLRASGRLPLGAGPPVVVAGRRYLDGGLTDTFPVARALADGADEVVAVLNRPPEPRGPEPRLAAWIVDRRYPGLGAAVRRHHEDWNGSVDLVLHPPEGVDATLVHPAEATGLGRLTRDPRKLQVAIAHGEADGRAFVADRRGS